MFFKLKDLLPQAINRLGMAKEFNAAYILEVWNEVSDEILVGRITGLHKAAYFKDGDLTIYVKNSIVSSEIQLYCRQLINGINKKIGKPLVKKLSFKVKKII